MFVRQRLGFLLLLSLLPLGPLALAAQTHVTLRLGALHAAALTPARGAGDSTDGVVLLLAVVGPGSSRKGIRLPADGAWELEQDQVAKPTNLASLTLSPGDSTRIVVAVMVPDDPKDLPASAPDGLASAVGGLPHPLTDPVGSPAVLATKGRVLATASLLLIGTKEGARWLRLDCLTTCGLLQPLPESDTGTALSAPVTAVLEMKGGEGLFHMQVTAKVDG